MSWHKLTLKVIDVLALLGHRCLGTHQLPIKGQVKRKNTSPMNYEKGISGTSKNRFLGSFVCPSLFDPRMEEPHFFILLFILFAIWESQ